MHHARSGCPFVEIAAAALDKPRASGCDSSIMAQNVYVLKVYTAGSHVNEEVRVNCAVSEAIEYRCWICCPGFLQQSRPILEAC